VTGSFAARVPWIAAHVGVDVGHLGLALLMPGIGAMLAMPFSGRLAHRYPFRPLVAATIAAWSAGLVLPSLPTSLAVLCVVLLLFGATAGVADMAMHAQGVLVEKEIGRSVMSSFHGFWSAGVLAGSAGSAFASHVGIDTRIQFVAVGLVLAAVGVAAARFLIDDAAGAEAEAEAPPAFALPTWRSGWPGSRCSESGLPWWFRSCSPQRAELGRILRGASPGLPASRMGAASSYRA
jgi:predicted MFS family arabinose efflux permease